MEALLGGGGGGGFPPMLDIPPDADDETMVELAIALSLQDHEVVSGGGSAGGLVNLQALGELQALGGVVGANSANSGGSGASGSQAVVVGSSVGSSQGHEAGHYSDTTASAGGSDDEGSTAATDGSTLRTSPADQVIFILIFFCFCSFVFQPETSNHPSIALVFLSTPF